MIRIPPSARIGTGVVAFLAILFLLEWTGAVNTAQTIDEAVHLASGFSYLVTGDFRLNPEHPPLLKELAALPLLFLPVSIPLDHASWAATDQWEFGRQFLYHNTLPAQTILLAGRFPLLLMSLVLGLTVFLWSRRLFGTFGGFLSLGIIAFEPNTIAHGQLITTDVGFALFFLLTVRAFVAYVERPSIWRASVVGLAFGAAQAAKYSALLLIPIIAVLLTLALFHTAGKALREQQRRRRVIEAIVFAFVAFGVVWLTYGFEFRTPASHPRIEQLYAERQAIADGAPAVLPPFAKVLLPLTDPKTALGQTVLRAGRTISLPLITYFRGLGSVVAHNSFGHTTYAAGKNGEDGWWWYFPYAVLMKAPAGLLLLLPFLACALIADIRRRVRRATEQFGRMRWFAAAPYSLIALIAATTLFFLMSMTSHINLGIRHVLIVFPTIAILLGSLPTYFRFHRRQAVLAPIAGLLLLWIPVRTLIIHPYELAYFNEFGGGPAQGHRHLLDSNLDWGQDLLRFRHYLDDHPPTAGIIRLAYFGSADVSYYFPTLSAIPVRLASWETPPQGTYAVSIGLLFDRSGDYDWLQAYDRTTTIGYSIAVYDFPQR